VLGKEAWPRKKFSVSPVPSATVSKAFADGLIACAEPFRLSANPRIPVVAYDWPWGLNLLDAMKFGRVP
jgi:hypothetical protein